MTLKDHLSVYVAFATIFVLPFLRFLFKLYEARQKIWRLRKQGLVCHPGEVSTTYGSFADVHPADATMEPNTWAPLLLLYGRLYPPQGCTSQLPS